MFIVVDDDEVVPPSLPKPARAAAQSADRTRNGPCLTGPMLPLPDLITSAKRDGLRRRRLLKEKNPNVDVGGGGRRMRRKGAGTLGLVVKVGVEKMGHGTLVRGEG